MGLEQIIFSRLTTSPDADPVKTLIGTDDPRAFPALAPMYEAGAYPQIVYELGERKNNETYNDGPSPIANQSAKLHCVAETYDEARALADAIRPLFNDTKGTWAGKAVQGSFIEEEQDGEVSIETDAGEQRKLYVVNFDVALWFDAT